MDLRSAVFIAMHSSVNSVDHLSELLKQLGQGSKLENLKLHRTKCSKLISQVIAPVLLRELIKDVKDSWFAIIVDESTDISTTKFMAFCMQYFGEKKNGIVTDFMGLVTLESATAQNIFMAFIEFLNTVGLSLQRLNALGTDGASSLCGKHESLYAILKKEVPQLQLLKCICHSIDKCASKACEELPSSLEYLIQESRNCFSHSFLRREQYRALYETINDEKIPSRLVQLSDTRWIVRYPAVKKTLEQWVELKALFTSMASKIRLHCTYICRNV